MRTKKLLFFLFFIVVALCVSVSPLAVKIVKGNKLFDSVFTESLGLLPVQSAGRVMPMSSASADILKTVSGKSTIKIDGKKISSTQWLWSLCANAEKMSNLPVLRTDNRKLQELLKATGRYVSYEAVALKNEVIYQGAQNKEGGAYAKACNEILNASHIFALASNSLCVKYPHEKTFSEFLKNWNVAVSSASEELTLASKSKREPNAEKLIVASEYLKFLRELAEYENHYNNEILKTIPINDGFSTPVQILLDRASPEVSVKILTEYSMLADSLNLGDFEEAQNRVSEIFKIFESSKNINLFRIKVEYIFNSADPFFSALLLFGMAFVLFGLSVFKKDVFSMPASVFLFVGSVVYVLAILVRVYIQMRPPVTNFYSSVVFTGAVASAFGLVMFLKKGSVLSALSASFVGMLSLLVAINLPHSGDTMGMMRAVLNSNFWLSTHVMTIMIGYCGLFLAGFGASFRLVANLFSKKNFGIETSKTADGIYVLLCVCLLFTFMGTMLGGIWADMSWGRFWGWDPKENGALMIVLWTSATIHCKALKVCNDRFFLVLTALGNIVVAWAWFGVNLLGVGLHSYGFIDGGWGWFFVYIILQILVVSLGFVVYKDRGNNLKDS